MNFNVNSQDRNVRDLMFGITHETLTACPTQSGAGLSKGIGRVGLGAGAGLGAGVGTAGGCEGGTGFLE